MILLICVIGECGYTSILKEMKNLVDKKLLSTPSEIRIFQKMESYMFWCEELNDEGIWSQIRISRYFPPLLKMNPFSNGALFHRGEPIYKIPVYDGTLTQYLSGIDAVITIKSKSLSHCRLDKIDEYAWANKIPSIDLIVADNPYISDSHRTELEIIRRSHYIEEIRDRDYERERITRTIYEYECLKSSQTKYILTMRFGYPEDSLTLCGINIKWILENIPESRKKDRLTSFEFSWHTPKNYGTIYKGWKTVNERDIIIKSVGKIFGDLSEFIEFLIANAYISDYTSLLNTSILSKYVQEYLIKRFPGL